MNPEPIWFRLPPPSDALPVAPAAPGAARGLDHHRRPRDRGARRLHDSRRLPRRRRRRADALLPRDADAGQRVPRLRSRGGRGTRPRPGLLAPDRAEHGGSHALAACGPVAQARPRTARLVRGPVDGADARPMMREYGADPERFGRVTPSAVSAAPSVATVHQPPKIDNELYMRDYSKCVLCYKCVEACGTDAQHTFAIAVAGRGFDAHISTEFDVTLPESACVYCGNCIAVCPTGALMPSHEYELQEGRGMAAGDADRHRYHLPVLRRRLHAQRPRPGSANREGDLAARERSHARQPVREGPLRLRVREQELSWVPAARRRDLANQASGSAIPPPARWPHGSGLRSSPP